MLEWDILNYLKKWRTNLRATRKALQIQQRLMNPAISLKQIMYEFKFATSSHFNFYCKQHLGAAPMQIRNSNKDDNMSTLP